MEWSPQELVDCYQRLIREKEALRDQLLSGAGPEADELRKQLPELEASLERLRRDFADTKLYLARLAERN